MASKDEEIGHVSDTALLVAACRAMETARPDGLVRDPFAERLAGARGMAIAQSTPGLELLCFGVGIRSRFIDRLLTDALTTLTIRTVVSVGSGLDTRPWRLDLPADLRWIEVDFPAMLDYKSSHLNPDEPRCGLEHVAADLNDASGRQAVFSAAGTAPALMITEGLLMYLPAATVEALATESVTMSGIRHWILDLTSPEMARRAGMDSRTAVQNVRAPGHLDGAGILDAVRRSGWTLIKHLSYTRDVLEAATERVMAIVRQQGGPEAMAIPADDFSGIHLFGRG
jgi:methyltransferase (TIGR00027 family)